MQDGREVGAQRGVLFVDNPWGERFALLIHGVKRALIV